MSSKEKLNNFNNKIVKENKEKKKKSILKKIGGAILYILIVVSLVYFMPKGLSIALQTEYPMAAITSGSMWPELKKGDLIFIQGLDNAKERVQSGDIVVYINKNNAFTIHRVIELKEDTLITKGDANNVSDQPIKYEDIAGRLLRIKNWNARLPKLGFISIMANKKLMN